MAIDAEALWVRRKIHMYLRKAWPRMGAHGTAGCPGRGSYAKSKMYCSSRSRYKAQGAPARSIRVGTAGEREDVAHRRKIAQRTVLHRKGAKVLVIHGVVLRRYYAWLGAAGAVKRISCCA